MKYYFAPMEGLTDSIFRQVHHRYFPGVDTYFMPFLSPTVHRRLTPREERELPAADSVPFRAVPQVLTKDSDSFLWAAQVCLDRGYDEVNLNCGCPSGTVVAKGKGSGMLANPDALDRFLGEVFAKSPISISVKTRLGLEAPEEFYSLLEVFNRYPIRELTLHPRVRRQFYSGSADREMFQWAWKNSANPLCFNGDISSLSQVEALREAFPGLQAVMMGRGLIADPGMLCGGTDVRLLESYMAELMETYATAFGSTRNAMFRLKEHWGLLQSRFPGGEKLFKRLRKTTDIAEYRCICAEIFHTLEFR